MPKLSLARQSTTESVRTVVLPSTRWSTDRTPNAYAHAKQLPCKKIKPRSPSLAIVHAMLEPIITSSDKRPATIANTLPRIRRIHPPTQKHVMPIATFCTKAIGPSSVAYTSLPPKNSQSRRKVGTTRTQIKSTTVRHAVLAEPKDRRPRVHTHTTGGPKTKLLEHPRRRARQPMPQEERRFPYTTQPLPKARRTRQK